MSSFVEVAVDTGPVQFSTRLEMVIVDLISILLVLARLDTRTLQVTTSSLWLASKSSRRSFRGMPPAYSLSEPSAPTTL